MMDRRPSFSFDELEVVYIREVASADIAVFVDDISDDFMVVRSQRRNFAVAAGGVGLADAAIVLVLGAALIVAKSFLEELGKDAYASLRRSISRLYHGRRGITTGHGYYHPLAILTELAPVTLNFLFVEGLKCEGFDEALVNIAPIVRATMEESISEGTTIQFGYDQDVGRWIEVFRFQSGGR